MSALTDIPAARPARRFWDLLRSRPWLVAVVAAIVLYLVLIPFASEGPGQALLSNIYLASFTAVAALAQMLVVTTGRGAIDLSIPNTITLCVYVATIIQNNSDANLPGSIAAALAVGALVGAVNGFAVVILRIPAMVATLAVGFIIQSVVQVLSSSSGHSGASPALAAAARGSVLGVPIFVIIAVVVTVVVGLIVYRTGFGLRLIATGQNDMAALVAGLRPGRTRFAAFVLAGALTAVTAVLLGGYSGGASLGVGTSFLISSIAAVVLGGTLMSGGMATIGGTFAGAILLTLLVTLTNTFSIPSGARSAIEGLVILFALAVGSVRQR